ncbi:MAG: LytTR family transcriptional regulator [Bacteroidales bacterium]|nr:LytTR family transcriptional regulator [Bacteroidales bacterium]MBO7479180.1 LytTR family transcriptional regulator [Bacteroidales bacterium]MBO7487249.1 LytTR family transcriptional regulator [Bacteroidales bacterium]
MKPNNRLLGKYSSQLWYIVLIPLFFLVFVIGYKPFNIENSVLCSYPAVWAGENGRYQFNIVMIMCIILMVLVLSRTLLYLLRRSLSKDGGNYFIWISGEFLAMTLFTALYVTLITKGAMTYFNALLYSFIFLLAVLIFPYALITLSQLLKSAGTSKAAIVDDTSSRVRFYDDKHTLKFVIAASAILYIEAQENYVRIYYMDADQVKSYQLRATMKKLEESLTSNDLIRCHRSYFINPSHIHALRKDKDNYIYAEIDDLAHTAIPISKKYYEVVSEQL